MGRLKPDVTIRQANANLGAVSRRARGAGPETAQGLEVQRRAIPQQLRPRQHQAGAVAAAWRRRVSAAHRLRERRQPAARARQHPAARAGRAQRHGRFERRHRPSTARREPGAGARGRRPGRGHGIGAARCDRRADAGIHAAVGDRDHAQRARAALRVHGLPHRWRRLGLRARLASRAREPGRDDEGRRAFGGRRPSGAQTRAGGPRGRPRVDVAGRRRHRDARVDSDDQHQPRLSRRERRHLRSSGCPRPSDDARGGRGVLPTAARRGLSYSRRCLGVALDRPAHRRHSFWRRLRHRRPASAERRRPARRRHQHGDARLLRDARHSDPSRPRVHGTGPRGSGTRGHRERRVCPQAPVRRRACGPALPDGELESRHGGRLRSGDDRVADRRCVRQGHERRSGRDPFPEMDLPFWQRPHRRASVTLRTAGDTAAVHQSVAAIVQRNSTPSCLWPTSGRWSRW